MVAVVIILSTVITVRFTVTNYSDDDGLHYAPTDTRIIPVSKALCQGLTLSVQDTLYGSYSAQLYMLDSQPKLTGSERFSFNAQPSLFDEYKYYYFYMYPGSNLTVTACISDFSSGQSTFYLIKGNNHFNKWKDDVYSAPNKMKFKISDRCQLNTNVTHSFKVTEEDYYYLIFENELYTSTSVDTYMTFYRTLYELPSNSSVDDSCYVNSEVIFDSCYVSVPLSGGKVPFLMVTPPTPDYDIDWTDGVGLDTTCSPRIWMYVVISLCSLLGLAAIIVPILVCAIIYFKKNKKGSASTSASSTAVDTPNTPLIASPPPPAANPNYPDPPAYGTSNYTAAPPEYKV